VSRDNIEKAIIALLHQAARLADERRFEDWVRLFAEDGSYSAITYENFHDQGLYLFKDDGIEALKERAIFLTGFWKVPRGKTLHTISNIQIGQCDADSATALSYFTLFRTGDMEHSELHACGEYQDEFVRNDNQWLFKQRRVIVDSNVLPSGFTELL
jgi:3-phenylpropionate/cinnamic acid dioxygenase small subunit